MSICYLFLFNCFPLIFITVSWSATWLLFSRLAAHSCKTSVEISTVQRRAVISKQHSCASPRTGLTTPAHRLPQHLDGAAKYMRVHCWLCTERPHGLDVVWACGFILKVAQCVPECVCAFAIHTSVGPTKPPFTYSHTHINGLANRLQATGLLESTCRAASSLLRLLPLFRLGNVIFVWILFPFCTSNYFVAQTEVCFCNALQIAVFKCLLYLLYARFVPDSRFYFLNCNVVSCCLQIPEE